MTYYVSNSIGNNNWDGVYPEHSQGGKHGPWKTLGKVSLRKFNPGDKILFKCGDAWNGRLILKGNGAPTDPNNPDDPGWITVASYGGDPFANRPKIKNTTVSDKSSCFVISGLRTYAKPAIVIHNYGGWRIKDLEIFDAEHGIIVDGTGTTSDLPNFRFDDLYIHHIYGYPVVLDGADTSKVISRSEAIGFIGNFYGVPDRYRQFQNVTIRNCRFINVAGIFQISGATNVRIDGIYNDNTDNDPRPEFHNTEGIRAGAIENLIIENSTLLHPGYPSGVEHGIAHICIGGIRGDSVIRNCELAYATDPMTNDGCAIDYMFCQNLYTINCYIHDNYSAAFLFHGLSVNSGFKDCILYNNGTDQHEQLGFPSPPTMSRFYDIELPSKQLGDGDVLRNLVVKANWSGQYKYLNNGVNGDTPLPNYREGTGPDANIVYEFNNAPTVLTSRIYDSTDWRVKYNGTGWVDWPWADNYFGAERETRTTGDSYEFSFQGTIAKIYAYGGDWCGAVDIYVDDMEKPAVDNYDLKQAPYGPQAMILYLGPFEEGLHHVKVVLVDSNISPIDKIEIVP